MDTFKNKFLSLQNLKGKSYLFQSCYLKLVCFSLMRNFAFLRLVWNFSILISMFFTAERKQQRRCSVLIQTCHATLFPGGGDFPDQEYVTVNQKVFSFAAILHSAGINPVIQMYRSWGHLLSCYQHKTIWKGTFLQTTKKHSYHFFFSIPV